MSCWSPLWSQIVNSSLWREPYHVRILFTSMLAVKDRNFIVYGDSFKLSDIAKITEEEAIDGLRVLSSPDTKRIAPQEYEGRRIRAVEGGWLILNAQKYRDMVRREYKLQWQREARTKAKLDGTKKDIARRATEADKARREAYMAEDAKGVRT